jgi:hypothetical protein
MESFQKIKVIILIILFIIFFGFIKGYNEESILSCTEIWCYPPIGVGAEWISCNSCFLENPLFSLGFFKAVKICNGTEYLIFNDGNYFDSEVVVDFTSCKYSFR